LPCAKKNTQNKNCLSKTEEWRIDGERASDRRVDMPRAATNIQGEISRVREFERERQKYKEKERMKEREELRERERDSRRES
jgi:hypothetical protein